MNQPGFNPYAAPTGPPSVGGFGFHNSDVGVPADRGVRLIAKVIDGLCDLVAIAPGLVLLMLGAGGNESALVIVGGLLMVLGLLAISIYQWLAIVRSGQTIGKRAMKIKIVRQDGSPVDFVYGVALRNWPIAIGAQLIPALGLIDALIIFTEQRRCLHDMLASTDVIQVL